MFDYIILPVLLYLNPCFLIFKATFEENDSLEIMHTLAL